MLGDFDDQYFVTLEPGDTVDITAEFTFTKRLDNLLVAGHRYRFGFSDRECVGNWMHGTREEVMLPPGDDSPMDKGGPIIMLDTGPPTEFEVLQSEPLGHEPQQLFTSTHGRSMQQVKFIPRMVTNYSLQTSHFIQHQQILAQSRPESLSHNEVLYS